MSLLSSTTSSTPDNGSKRQKLEWNYHPDIPIDNNPLFSWPIRLKDTLIYYRDSWLALSEGTIFIILAILTWQFFSPELETARNLHWSWAGGIWLRNFLVLLVVAGVLHYYFFARKQQGIELKYVSSFMSRGSRFLLNNQLWDNMFYALVSGVLIWSCCSWAQKIPTGTSSSRRFRSCIWSHAGIPFSHKERRRMWGGLMKCCA